MVAAPHKVSGNRSSAMSIVGRVEGWLALALLTLGILAPRVDHPSNAEVIGDAVYSGIVFGLALAGVRFGRGGGRFAAWIVLGVLSLLFLAVLASGVARWEEVLWYWRH